MQTSSGPPCGDGVSVECLLPWLCKSCATQDLCDGLAAARLPLPATPACCVICGIACQTCIFTALQGVQVYIMCKCAVLASGVCHRAGIHLVIYIDWFPAHTRAVTQPVAGGAQISAVVWMFSYPLRTALAVGLSMAQIGEFAFVLLSVASHQGLLAYQVYMLLMGARWPMLRPQDPIVHAVCFHLVASHQGLLANQVCMLLMGARWTVCGRSALTLHPLHGSFQLSRSWPARRSHCTATVCPGSHQN